MVKVTLKDGTTVEVSKGMAGYWNRQTIEENKRTPTDIGATLDIRDKDGYGGKVVASFRGEEVVCYEVDGEGEEDA